MSASVVVTLELLADRLKLRRVLILYPLREVELPLSAFFVLASANLPVLEIRLALLPEEIPFYLWVAPRPIIIVDTLV